MCAHPYDNCGPVWSHGPCVTCNPDHRSGSILGSAPRRVAARPDVVEDGVHVMPAPSTAPTRAVRPAPGAATPPAAQEGDGRPEAAAPRAPAEVSNRKYQPAPPGTREGATRVLSVKEGKAKASTQLVQDDPPVMESDELSPPPEQPPPRKPSKPKRVATRAPRERTWW
jgi:hypothetical protein